MPDLPPENWLAKALSDNPAAWPENAPESYEKRVLEACAQNGVTALLCHHMANHGGPHQLPQRVGERLKANLRTRAITEMVWQREITEVLNELTASGMQPLLLKGTPLAYNLYPDPYLRERCDTDMLFASKQEAESALRLLAERGYSRSKGVTGKYISYQCSCWRQLSAGVNLTFDIHWKLNNDQGFARKFTFAELRANYCPVPALGPAAHALSAVNALLHACLHRLAHVSERQENLLIWLYDIKLLCNRLGQDGWEELSRTAAKKGLTAETLDGLKAASAILQFPLPDMVENLEGNTGAAEIYLKPGSARGIRLWRNFQMLPTWEERIGLMREHLFPSAGYMLTKYNTTSRIMLPVLYMRRIIGAIPKLFR